MLKFGILGAGQAAAAHADGITRSGIGQVTKIYAPGDGAVIAPRYGARPASSLEEVLGDSAIDAVVIASPTDKHIQAAKAVILAGKHLLCEVPLARALSEIEELEKLVTNTPGITAAAALTCRFDPAVVHLRKALQTQELGTIGTIRLGRLDTFRPGADTWYANFARSGGVALNSLPQLLDITRFCFGEVERVQVMRAPATDDLNMDYVLAAGRLASGALLHLEVSWSEPGDTHHFYYEIAGSHGILEYDTRIEPKLDLQPKSGGKIPFATASEALNQRNPAAITPHQSLATDFIEAIRKNRAPAASLADALIATRITLIAADGAETRS